MGRTVAPKYRVEYVTTGPGRLTASGWRGCATWSRLREHVEALDASFRPGGANAHAGEMVGMVRGAHLVRQSDGKRVETYVRPGCSIEWFADLARFDARA